MNLHKENIQVSAVVKRTLITTALRATVINELSDVSENSGNIQTTQNIDNKIKLTALFYFL
jgi:hypothetical protein